MNVNGTDNWPVEKVEQLTALRVSGLSMGQIAYEMHLSRGSVIGKLTRLGISGKNGTEPKRVPKPKAPKAPKPPKPERPAIMLTKSTPPAVIRDVPPAPNSKPVSILDVKPHHCRSVLTKRDKRGRHSLAMFCGGQKTAGSSYCAFHDRLYRQPPKDIPNG